MKCHLVGNRQTRCHVLEEASVFERLLRFSRSADAGPEPSGAGLTLRNQDARSNLNAGGSGGRWASGKQDGGPSGRMRAREAKKAAGQERRPPGKPKTVILGKMELPERRRC